jgi:hypothetical protein
MEKKPGIVFMPHANIRYSQLRPEKRAWVIKASYESIMDVCRKENVKIAFEASGETIEIIAKEGKDFLKKLKELIKEGLVEPVSSPYTHIMIGNVEPEVGYYSLVRALDTWEKYVGVRPKVGWNPECGWAYFLPEIFKRAGFKMLVLDWDSFLLSTVEGLREKIGLHWDVRGHSNKSLLFKIEEQIKNNQQILKTLYSPCEIIKGFYGIFRSDMLCNKLLWFLMGASEVGGAKVTIEDVKESIVRWKGKIKNNNGFLMPYAEDAEYIGTTAYFYVKQFGMAKFFEPAQDSAERFGELIRLAKEENFEFVFPTETLKKYEIVKDLKFEKVERGLAWHGGTTLAWSNTVYSRIMDPICRNILSGIHLIAKKLRLKEIIKDPDLKRALESLTSAYISDSRWPPAPTSPGRFNVNETLSDLEDANNQLALVMKKRKIVEKDIYSYDIIKEQIKVAKEELMGFSYFEEK